MDKDSPAPAEDDAADLPDQVETTSTEGDGAAEMPPPPPPSTPPAVPPPVAASQSSNFDVIGIILGGVGILSICYCGMLSIPLGIAAIVLGQKGRREAQAMGKPESSSKVAIWLGIASLALAVLTTILFLVFYGGLSILALTQQ